MTATSSLPAFGRTTSQTFDGSPTASGRKAPSTQPELGADTLPAMPEEGVPALTLLARAALFIVGEGLSVGLFLWALFSGPSTTPYSVDNQLPIDERRVPVGLMLGLAGLGSCAGLFAYLRRGRRGLVRTFQVAARLSPLMLLGFLPFLLRWQLWQTRELTLAVLAGIYGLGAYAAFLTALRAPPLFSASFADYARRATAQLLARLRSFLPITLVVLGVLGYTTFFSYYTLQNHRNLLTA